MSYTQYCIDFFWIIRFTRCIQLFVDGHNIPAFLRRKNIKVKSWVFFLFALLNILFIYLFNSNTFKIWIGCACLVIWYREIPHGPSMLLCNMCSMSLKNFNFGIEKVLAFIQFSLILTERNKPRWRFVIFHPNSLSTTQSVNNSSVIYLRALKSSVN